MPCLSAKPPREVENPDQLPRLCLCIEDDGSSTERAPWHGPGAAPCAKLKGIKPKSAGLDVRLAALAKASGERKEGGGGVDDGFLWKPCIICNMYTHVLHVCDRNAAGVFHTKIQPLENQTLGGSPPQVYHFGCPWRVTNSTAPKPDVADLKPSTSMFKATSQKAARLHHNRSQQGSLPSQAVRFRRS